MPTGFIPTRLQALLAWMVNFSARITATPSAFGLVASQCSAMSALVTSFNTALTTSTNPATRTRGTVAATEAARTPMIAMARDLARIINAFPSITNQQRIDLGLTPRSGQFRPINPPTEQPVMEVVGAVGRTLKVKIRGQDSSRRGKPAGVSGASVFTYVGDAPPADIADWVFESSTSRMSFDIVFPPATPAGSQVWLTCFFYNPRAQSGPASTPISAYLAGGVSGNQEKQDEKVA